MNCVDCVSCTVVSKPCCERSALQPALLRAAPPWDKVAVVPLYIVCEAATMPFFSRESGVLPLCLATTWWDREGHCELSGSVQGRSAARGRGMSVACTFDGGVDAAWASSLLGAGTVGTPVNLGSDAASGCSGRIVRGGRAVFTLVRTAAAVGWPTACRGSSGCGVTGEGVCAHMVPKWMAVVAGTLGCLTSTELGPSSAEKCCVPEPWVVCVA